jgi:CHAD domain-containing protein
MVRKGKWIEGTQADQPVSVAARRALEIRLAVLWYYLPLAARHAAKDVEYVHQLRVAARRAVATLDTFWEVLPPKRARWLQKQLKRVRRAAGEARDDDVLAERLEKWKSRYAPVAIVLKQVRRHRQAAQAPIEAIHRKLVRSRFEQRLSDLLDRVRWRGEAEMEPCFALAARQNLQPLLEHFFDEAAADLHQLEALHQFRIAGKQLRYAMELFATAFPAEFRSVLYCEVEQLQTLLGEVNDHATARMRLDRWLIETHDEELIAALRRLAAAESRALRRSRDKFHQWWTADRAAKLRAEFESIMRPDQHGC